MTISLDKDTVQDKFRVAVLAALDETARDVFGKLGFAVVGNGPGAADADLPELFRDIDRHVERLCARYDIVLVDGLAVR